MNRNIIFPFDDLYGLRCLFTNIAIFPKSKQNKTLIGIHIINKFKEIAGATPFESALNNIIEETNTNFNLL